MTTPISHRTPPTPSAMPDLLPSALLAPSAYPHPVTTAAATGRVELLQTHISWVFLTGDYVYKVKKPVNFGFLDFTTLESRRQFCHEELRVNSRLSPELYLEVVPLVMRGGDGDGEGDGGEGLRVGPGDGGGGLTGSSGIADEGEAVEWAVKMRQLPQASLMPAQLAAGKVTPSIMAELARQIAAFHARAATGDGVDEHGSLATVRYNWQENFDQTQNLKGTLIPGHRFEALEQKINTFMDRNSDLFASRVAAGRVRECHGDLHAGNIFVIEDERPVVFDAIEFNRRFSCSDVAAEIAFLAMDLEYRGYPELASHFVGEYTAASKDEQLLQLLDFYKAYRAYVRGKVLSFKLGDEGVNPQAKEQARQEATRYFELAGSYMSQPSTNQRY